MVILGPQYCPRAKVCSLDPAKVTKHVSRISQLLNAGFATSKIPGAAGWESRIRRRGGTLRQASPVKLGRMSPHAPSRSLE